MAPALKTAQCLCEENIVDVKCSENAAVMAERWRGDGCLFTLKHQHCSSAENKANVELHTDVCVLFQPNLYSHNLPRTSSSSSLPGKTQPERTQNVIVDVEMWTE